MPESVGCGSTVMYGVFVLLIKCVVNNPSVSIKCKYVCVCVCVLNHDICKQTLLIPEKNVFFEHGSCNLSFY